MYRTWLSRGLAETRPCPSTHANEDASPRWHGYGCTLPGYTLMLLHRPYSGCYAAVQCRKGGPPAMEGLPGSALTSDYVLGRVGTGLDPRTRLRLVLGSNPVTQPRVTP